MTAALLGCLLDPSARAGDWPQWRGEKRDGVAHGEKLPSPLPKELKQLWRVDVGLGYSSPAVVDGRVFLMTRVGESEGFVALDAKTGERIWRYEYELPYKVHSAAVNAGPGPKASVAVADGKVYGLGISEALTCLNAADGKVVWQYRFDKEFSPAWPETGASASPLIVDGLCVTQIGREKSGGLAAFDAKTGKQAWVEPGDGPSYAAPEPFDYQGHSFIVSFTQESFVFVTGGVERAKLPFKTPYGQNIVSPVFYNGTIIYTGLDNGVTAIKPTGFVMDTGKMPDLVTEEVWKNKDHFSYMNAPVLHNDHIFFLSDKRKGSMICLDARDGTQAWVSPGRYADYVSAIRVEGTLLILTDAGELILAPASPEKYEEIAKYRVAESQTWAHPVVAHGRLYIKDWDHLACFEF